MNAGLRRNSFFHAFLYWAVPTWPVVREYYITSFMKLLGFQASLGTQLTTLITHDDARITILEMHHVKQSFFSSNQPIILRKLIVPLLISSLPFVIETVEIALSLKKNTKQKINFDFVRVLRAHCRSFWSDGPCFYDLPFIIF